MATFSVQEIEKKLPGFLQRAFAFARRIIAKTKWLFGVTSDAVTAGVEKEQHVIGSHIDYHRLGVEVYRLMCRDPHRDALEVTKRMRELIVRINSAQDEIDKRMRKLEHMTVVERNNDASPPAGM